jgi:hypothetical protein
VADPMTAVLQLFSMGKRKQNKTKNGQGNSQRHVRELNRVILLGSFGIIPNPQLALCRFGVCVL